MIRILFELMATQSGGQKSLDWSLDTLQMKFHLPAASGRRTMRDENQAIE